MIVRAVIAGLLLAVAPTLEECQPSDGGGGEVEECWPFCPVEEQQQAADDGCPPPVAVVYPGAGTVVDTRVCPGWFGVDSQYIRVDPDGSRGRVWLPDPGWTCEVGDDWGPSSC